jgi:hypothetical protein
MGVLVATEVGITVTSTIGDEEVAGQCGSRGGFTADNGTTTGAAINLSLLCTPLWLQGRIPLI